MSTEQFGRYYELLIGGRLIKNLQIDFKGTRTSKKQPNTLDLNVKNLNKKNRDAFQQAKDLVVQLSAGYTDKHGVIYLGEAREVYSVRNGTTWNTFLGCGDKEKAQRKARVSKSFAPGTSYETVLKSVAESMPGIDLGNVKQMASAGKLPGGITEFVNGLNISGNTSQEFDRLVKVGGLEWSIQDGKLQILEATKSLQDRAVVLTPNTGLVGSPTISSDGTLNFDCLLNSDIIPGKQVKLESEHVDSFFKVERVEYDGDYEGNPWYIHGEAEELEVQ